MKGLAYYNEFDKNAAAWLNQLIIMGKIAYGVVDERSITDVTASDLRGFTQHHFFAGVGGWSYALRLAGWGDDRPVWTASLPCQPFSAAGKQLGKADERHLLPHFLELVRQCQPNRIFGEQVEGAIRHGWLDDLQTTMEAEGYAVGHCVLGAHSIGSYHQRQRLYWVASERMGNAEMPERGQEDNGRTIIDREEGERYESPNWIGEHGVFADVERLYCRDNKYRPIKPGLKPLVDGIPRGMGRCGDPSLPINANDTAEARVMRLKGYGNAIVPQVAAEFIGAYMDIDETVITAHNANF